MNSKSARLPITTLCQDGRVDVLLLEGFISVLFVASAIFTFWAVVVVFFPASNMPWIVAGILVIAVSLYGVARKAQRVGKVEAWMRWVPSMVTMPVYAFAVYRNHTYALTTITVVLAIHALFLPKTISRWMMALTLAIATLPFMIDVPLDLNLWVRQVLAALLGIIFLDFAGRRIVLLANSLRSTQEKLVAQNRELLEAKTAIEENRNQLEHLVRKRTAELEASNASLVKARVAAESANVAKSAFLANMSHEMRTPLNHIIGLTTLIRREPLTPKQTEKLSKLDAASHNLNTLINTVLELTHIEAGKFDMVAETFNLDELLHAVVSTVQDQATEKNLQVTLEAATGAASLIGDRKHIQLALLNYVTNAIRFTEVGGVTIRSQVTDIDAASVMIRFEVEDTGIGISPEDQSRLFSIFEQVDNSSTRKFGGLGVGLAMTKKIAQIMGGDAGCVSHPDTGSTFWFTVQVGKG